MHEALDIYDDAPSLSLVDEPADDAPPAPGTFEDRLRWSLRGHHVDAVARRAGVARETLRSFLRGIRKRQPYPQTIEAIAAACGVRPAWLAFGDGAPRVAGGDDAG